MRPSFHGSYCPNDVTFLLKPVSMAPTPVTEKEQAIQSGSRHYSEMLSEEKTPDGRYMQLFYQALDRNEKLFARHIASLARTLAQREDYVVLVSLARAGTPVGVLLHRALKMLGKTSFHYSISIIRDRGVDVVALDHILENHRDSTVVFVDGWTGKGAIASELITSIAIYNSRRGVRLDPSLLVVSDLAGMAGLAATSDDYLIPSSVLNAIVSGLVSRTVLNNIYVGVGDFHACVYYQDKSQQDLSRYFVDRLTPHIKAALDNPAPSPECTWSTDRREHLRQQSYDFMSETMQRYDITDRNRVKPGVGESTRALLRRLPDRLILRNPNDEETLHLRQLATAQAVPLEVDPELPYRAAVIIKTLGV